MQPYTLKRFEKHWADTRRGFERECDDCRRVIQAIVRASSRVASLLAGRRTLETNCAYLLLAKFVNHVSASLVLMERGLMVDAALTARNGLETSILLEYLCKEPDRCAAWAGGEEFSPGRVRRELAAMPRVEIGDLAIEVGAEEYEAVRFAYSWLSRITHANLESLNHSATATGDNSFVIHFGGELSIPVAVAVAQVLGDSAVRALVTCLVTHSSDSFEASRPIGEELRRSINGLRKIGDRS